MTKPLIAIVDDDRAIRTALSSLLRSAGFRAAMFDCAEAFLDDLKGGVPDCVLTDIQMPGMSGLDLQQHLASANPDLPVLVMTAFPEAKLRERAMLSGAHCFLNKPFDANELLRCIHTAIEPE